MAVPKLAGGADCIAAGLKSPSISEPNGEDISSAAQLVTNPRYLMGFTSVFDTGSAPTPQATAWKRASSRPMILSAGTPFTSKDATPYYLQPLKLPELETPEQATTLARARLDEGADAIKIFQGAWVSQEKVVPMPLELVKAVAAVAHARGKLLLAHPSDTAGLSSAIEGGVDVLTHVVESPGDVDASMVAEMRKRNMAVIPTLKLFGHNRNVDQLLAQLRAYSEAGIPILFGTDVGFITDYDPALEYRLMDRAGLNFPKSSIADHRARCPLCWQTQGRTRPA
jgi:hypothetical protein